MKQQLKNLLTRPKKQIQKIAKQNGLTLDPILNEPGLAVLKAIFNQREYADYFPFYQEATVVDVGAHFGYFSLFAAKNLAASSKVISLEPAPGNFAILEKNLSANQTTNVTPLEVALSAETGTQDIHLGRAENHTLLDQYALNKQPSKSTSVKTTSLEDLMATHSLDRINFLKLDCEGAEYEVLENTPAEVLQNVDTISLEFHDLKSPVRNGNSLCQLLTSHGFNIVKFTHEPSRLNLNFGKIVATSSAGL